MGVCTVAVACVSTAPSDAATWQSMPLLTYMGSHTLIPYSWQNCIACLGLCCIELLSREAAAVDREHCQQPLAMTSIAAWAPAVLTAVSSLASIAAQALSSAQPPLQPGGRVLVHGGAGGMPHYLQLLPICSRACRPSASHGCTGCVLSDC